MTHLPRDDYPGAWWHLTNRGIAKRAVNETCEDVERFYGALEAAIDKRLVEVHAFSVLTTHYHLLARSPAGEISAAMQIVGNRFVRWFNRTRRRDGSLYRGRFAGRRIDDPDYWCNVLRYIDLNPVRAGMCGLPSEHPYGSARAYRFGVGPEWLTRTEVMSVLAGHFAPGPVIASRYDEYACACDADANAHIVERLLRDACLAPPPLHDLMRAASIRQQGWMEWKAALADAVALGTAFLPPNAARRAAGFVERVLERDPLPASRADVARDVAAGLLRAAAGLSVEEVANELRVARSTVTAAVRRHERWMSESPRYADLVAGAVRSAIRRTLPAAVHPREFPRLVAIGAPAANTAAARGGPARGHGDVDRETRVGLEPGLD